MAPAPKLGFRFVTVILAAWLLHLTLGTVYCWGNIAPYVVSYIRWMGHDIKYEDMAFCISVTTAFQAISMFLSGFAYERFGIKPTAAAGCAVMSTGMFLCAFTAGLGKRIFLIFYAGIFGSGLGFVYMAPIVVLMKWLPTMKGLASGIVVAGFGSGALIFNIIQKNWINGHGLKPTIHESDGRYFDLNDPKVISQVLVNVPSLFMVQAAIFVVMQILGLLLLAEPPAPEALASKDPENAEESEPLLPQGPAQPEQQEYSCKQMVCTRQFWFLFGTVFCNAQIVLFLATTQKTMGMELIKNISDGDLTVIAGVASLCNGLGRVCWGLFNDKTNFRIAMATMVSFQALLLYTVSMCTTTRMYMMWVCLMFWNLGGNFALFPAATGTYFGTKSLATNYGIIFMVLAFSELMGSVGIELLLGKLSYQTMTRLMMVIHLVGGAMAVLMGPVDGTQMKPALSSGYEAVGKGKANEADLAYISNKVQ